jgi:ElaB/YqjD/DUF883 family membrane-anchored ribosome-binding protein
MSKASDKLEDQTEGDVPTADQVLSATAEEAGESLRHQRRRFEAGVRSDPLRAVAMAAGAGFLAAIVLRRI